jgi:DNA-binding MarR family transcriptional regulator
MTGVDLPEHLHLLHQPVRLRLMSLLYQRGEVGLSAACDALGTTPGNLDAHARRLELGGLVGARKELLRTGFAVRYRMTLSGRQAFQEYLVWLESVVKAARTPGSMDPTPE